MTLSEIAVMASGALVASVWQGTVLVACAGICLRMVPGLSATVRSVVWLAVFGVVGALDLVALPGASAGPGGGVAVDARWAMGVLGVWVAVALARLARLVAGAVRLAGIARRAAPLALAEGGGWRRAVVCTSAEVERPGVVGFLRPRILLPAGFSERLPAAELEAVVLHEREHLRRGDDWTNLLQKIGLAVMPLNPVLAWVERRLCRERELACDDRVLRETGARKAYAACLARLAEEAMLRKPLALALGLVGRGSELAGRIHRILAQPEAVLGSRAAMGVAGVVVCGLLGGASGLAHCPRVVSFVPREVAVAGTTVARASAPAPQVTPGYGRGMDGARMVKAVASMEPARSSVRRLAPSRGGVRMVRVRAPRRGTVQRRNWVVMTRWMDDGVGEPGVVRIRLAVPAGSMYSGVSYAGVPVGDGWLVFQL